MTSEPIDTAKLMRDIRANALGMPASSAHSPTHSVAPMMMSAEIDFTRTISSHRWLLRMFYVPIRRWVYREIRASMEPIVERQTEYNRAMQVHVAALTDQIEAQAVELEQLQAELYAMRVQAASRAR